MRYSLIILFAILLAGCGGKKADIQPDPVVTPPVAIPSPGKSTLLLPAANVACYTGTVISVNQSIVTFNWSTAVDADSYDLIIKDLLTGITVQQKVNSNQAQATLNRNTPFSWYVVSKSTKTTVTTNSDVNKFYNAGAGMTSYAPFPAELTGPLYNSAVVGPAVNLTWKGSSIDNNITGYDVYFGTTTNPPVFKNNVTDMFLNNVQISTGIQYYWKIVTKDAQSNISISEIYSFKVN